MLNVLTIDVEDWYQAISSINFKAWNRYEDRILASTERLLEILSENNTKATFFVLGYIAERYPALIRKIHKQGHEIACHSYSHKMVYNQSYEEFKQDLLRSKNAIEQIIGEKVIGFRAPWFSITKKSLWVLDILIELGFEYDSSIFPIRTKYYGMPNDNGSIYKVITANGQSIEEIAISKIRYFGLEFPVAGGFYFRILSYRIVKWAITKLNNQNKRVVFYIHPWELDFRQPRLRISLEQKIIHYTMLKNTENKFKRLLENFKFGTVKEALNHKIFL